MKFYHIFRHFQQHELYSSWIIGQQNESNVCAWVCMFGRHTCIVLTGFCFNLKGDKRKKRAIECITPHTQFYYIYSASSPLRSKMVQKDVSGSEWNLYAKQCDNETGSNEQYRTELRKNGQTAETRNYRGNGKIYTCEANQNWRTVNLWLGRSNRYRTENAAGSHFGESEVQRDHKNFGTSAKRRSGVSAAFPSPPPEVLQLINMAAQIFGVVDGIGAKKKKTNRLQTETIKYNYCYFSAPKTHH